MIEARLKAWREWRRARAAMFDAACHYARARVDHGRSQAWGDTIIVEWRAMCRERRRLEPGLPACLGLLLAAFLGPLAVAIWFGGW